MLMFAEFRGGGRRFGPPLNTPLLASMQQCYINPSECKVNYSAASNNRSWYRTLAVDGYVGCNVWYKR